MALMGRQHKPALGNDFKSGASNPAGISFETIPNNKQYWGNFLYLSFFLDM